MRRHLGAIVLAAVPAAVLVAYLPASAQVFLSRQQALDLAFGEGSAIERQAIYLTDAQLAAARRFAGGGVEINGALVTRYTGHRNGQPVGIAYFDTHRVRTLEETVMVVVAGDGTVDRVEILSFQEPPEYLPREGWLAQFVGRSLDRELETGRGIHGITGATLSARAITDATRRVLALHRAIAAETGEERP